MAETIVLDASGIAVNRTQLDITGYIDAKTGVDWGDGAIVAYQAEQAIGSSPVDYRLPNRTIKIPLILKAVGATSYATIITQLQQKVALLQREGGWLMRQVDSTPLYADVVNATLHLGGSWLQTYGSADLDAVLTIEAIPDWYGDEVTLDTITATGRAVSKLKLSAADAVIAGDHPARCRIVLTDTSSNGQQGVLWGFRARYYDSATTAALFYEAEALTPLDAAATFVHAGASGGSTMRHNALVGGSWTPVMSTTVLSGSAKLTHKGSYRVWARVYSATAAPQLRLVWGVGDVAHPITNAPDSVPGAGAFYLVDLGEVGLDAAPVGTHCWLGVIQALAVNQGDPVEIDCLYMVPVAESAGRAVAVQQPQSSAGGVNTAKGPTLGADTTGIGTIAWSNPTSIYAENDGAYASAALTSAQITHFLKATGFGFALPSTATISGVQVDVRRQDQSQSATDAAVRLVKAGTVQTPDKSSVTPYSSHRNQWNYVTYGGPTDLWSGTWLYSDINSATFGFAIAAQAPSGQTAAPRIDYLKITVYYTTSGGFTAFTDAVYYSSRAAELRTDGMFRQDSTGTVEGPIARAIGDLPRVPPSGLEARPVELLVKPSRGDMDQVADSGLDSFTAAVLYRPSYLIRP